MNVPENEYEYRSFSFPILSVHRSPDIGTRCLSLLSSPPSLQIHSLYLLGVPQKFWRQLNHGLDSVCQCHNFGTKKLGTSLTLWMLDPRKLREFPIKSPGQQPQTKEIETRNPITSSWSSDHLWFVQARSIGILSLKVYQQDGRALAWRLHPGTKKARKGNVGTSV